MRFASLFTGLMASTALAAPLQSTTQTTSKALLHPAVSALTECTLALGNVVSSIRAFDGKSEWDARRLEIDAINAINMLNNATNSILTQPNIDYMTALQFVPVAPGLFTGAYSLVNALSEKKAALQSTDEFARRTLNVLEATNSGVQNLVLALNQKLPGAVSLILSGLDNDVVRKIQDARDQFRYIGTPPPAVAGTASAAGPAGAASAVGAAGTVAAPAAVQAVAPPRPVYPSYPSYPQVQQQQQQQQAQPQYQPYSQPSWGNAQSQAQPQYPAYQPAGMDAN